MPTSPQSDDQTTSGSRALFFIQIFSTLAYSVLYITLVLFAIQALHVNAAQANHIMATFIAFNFALHLLGGTLGGRFLSFRGLFLIGMILQTIGCLFIATIEPRFFMLGMAIFLVGSGMDLPCINCMIAQLFHTHDKRREYAFLWNYSGMNIGFFIGVTVAGICQAKQAFHALFLFTSLTNIIALLLVLWHWKKLQDVKTLLTERNIARVKRGIIGVGIILAVIVVTDIILSHALFSTKIIGLLGIAMMLTLIFLTTTRKNKSEQRKLIAYGIFALASLVFYTIYELIPMALTLFLERNVDRHIGTEVIPTAWFLNINTALIIVGCPLLAYFTKQWRDQGRDISFPIFFAAGLICIGLSIIILPIGIQSAHSAGLISIIWPTITYALLALAEIALSPIGYAVVSELAPPELRGSLMGMWLLISGVSAVLSNIFSNMALGKQQSPAALISNPSYAHTFLLLGLSGIIAGIMTFVLKPILLKLMRSDCTDVF